MANTLNGLNLDQLSQAISDYVDMQYVKLISEGFSDEQARAIIAEAVNHLTWRMSANQSPVSD